MQEYLGLLKETKLFIGLDEGEISAMLGCMDAKLRLYKKGEFVLRQGQRLAHILLLAEGCLHIQQDDYWGKRSILGSVAPGDMFGEAYASSHGSPLLNDVLAVLDSAVICLDVERLLTVCSGACRFHSTVVRNLFYAVSEKNRGLVQKLGHMSQRSTREKLVSYLSVEAGKHSSASFSIPFNRQQLADFLSVDRSAMSTELGRMRDEGLIEFKRNNFTLLQGKQHASRS